MRVLGLARGWTFAIVAVPAPAVLVGDVAPAEVGQRAIGHDSQRLQRIDAPRSDRAQVLPVIAEIKHVGELLAEAEPAHGHPRIVEQVVRVPVLTWSVRTFWPRRSSAS